MEINKDNYEAFLLDLMEGNLQEDLKEKLKAFLDAHPELEGEWSDEFVVLSHEKPILSHEKPKEIEELKLRMKREEETKLPLYDYLLIAQVEGKLNEVEAVQLKDMAQHSSSVLKDLAEYSKTKLDPNEKIIFSDKASLKKTAAIRFPVARWLAVAAAIILAFYVFKPEEKTPTYLPYISKIKVPSVDLNPEPGLDHLVVGEREVNQQKPKATSTEPIQVNIANGNLAKERPLISPVEPVYEQVPVKVEMIAVKEEISGETKEIIMDEMELAEVVPNENPPSSKEEANREDDKFIPVNQYALKTIKNDLLKNKKVTEIIAEEIAELTNQKVSFKSKKNKEGESDGFAINIGKFSISSQK